MVIAVAALVGPIAVPGRAQAAGADLAPGRWRIADPAPRPRAGHTAVALAPCPAANGPKLCGRVLVVGGDGPTAAGSADAYDPASSSWSAVGLLIAGRAIHATTRLSDGSVLAAGGVTAGTAATTLATSETFDPGTGTWAPTRNAMTEARSGHVLVTLGDGRALAAGGTGSTGMPLASTELFHISDDDPSPTVDTTRRWTPAGTLAVARTGAAAVLLGDGRVLVAGGTGPGGEPVVAVELFDPITKTWSAGPVMAQARTGPTATVLADGRVLVAGGIGRAGPLTTAEVFDPVVGSWHPGGTMSAPRSAHTATRLSDGRVMVAGGAGATPALGSAEVYEPATGAWRPTGALVVARRSHTATALPDGQVLMVGGLDAAGAATAEAEIFDPAATIETPSVLEVSPSGGRTGATKLVSIRGRGFTGATAVSFGPAPAAILSLTDTTITAFAPRLDAVGKVRVVVTGPGGSSPPVDRARYRYAEAPVVTEVTPNAGAPGGGTTVVIGGTSLEFPETRVFFGDTLAPGVVARSDTRLEVTTPPRGAGVVDVTVITPAGQSAPSSLGRFTYDGGTWTPGPTAGQARYQHTATPLGDGKVLIAGGSTDFRRGSGGGVALDSAEIYDPAANSYTPTGSLDTARFDHTSTLLADGRVLVTGGIGDTGNGPDKNFELSTSGINHFVTDPARSQPSTTVGPAATLEPEAPGVEQMPPGSMPNVQTGPALVNAVRAIVSASPGTNSYVRPGTLITYTVSYYNPAASSASAVIVLKVPLQTDFVSADPGVEYDPAGRIAHRSLATVEGDTGGHNPAGSFTVTVRVRSTRADNGDGLESIGFSTQAQAEGRVSNPVRHTIRTSDRGTLTRATTSADPPAGSTVRRGDEITYTLALSNQGTIPGTFLPTADVSVDTLELVSVPDGATVSPSTALSRSLTIRFTKDPVEMTPGTTPDAPARTFSYKVRVRNAPFLGPLRSSEIFDPSTGRWSTAGSMSTPRLAHTATLVNGAPCRVQAPPSYCGKVLAAGGSVSDETAGPTRAPTATAELFDPVSQTWTPTASMDPACTIGGGCGRGNHTATALADGRVLVAGGLARFPLDPTAGVTTIPVDATMGPASMRVSNTILDPTLPGAAVLASETSDLPNLSPVAPGDLVTYTVSYYNVGTNPTARLNIQVVNRDLEFLSDNAGGIRNESGTEVRFANLAASPRTTSENPAGRITIRARVRSQSETVADKGTDVVDSEDPIAGTLISNAYNIETDGRLIQLTGAGSLRRVPGWLPGSALRLSVANSPRVDQPVALGQPVTYTLTYFNEGEDPALGAVARLDLNTAVEFISASDGGTFDPVTRVVTFPAVTVRPGTSTSSPAGRFTVNAVVSNPTHPVNTAELYDPVTGTWSQAPSMNIRRYDHTATTLADGQVLMVGGVFQLLATGTRGTDTSELYDPATDTWQPSGSTGDPYRGHRAVLLENGSVLVSGGSSSFVESPTSSPKTGATIYDPRTRRWHAAAPMGSERGIHALTVLGGPNCGRAASPAWCGKVLATGGARREPIEPAIANVPRAHASSEIYTPAPLPPLVGSVSPARGPSRGGTSVVITGSGMGEVGSVRFDGVESASVEVLSPTSVRAVAPPHASGPVDVVVARSGGVSTPARAAFTYEVSSAPGAVIDLSARNLASSGSSSSVELSFSAVNGDGAFGPVAVRYDIRQSRTPLTDEATFAVAARLCDPVCEFGPSGVGEALSLEIGGLAGATRYHYALRAVNPIGPGALSNPASVATPTPAAKAAQAIGTGRGTPADVATGLTGMDPTGTGSPPGPATPGTRLSVAAPTAQPRSPGPAAPATTGAPAPIAGSANPLLGSADEAGATREDLIAPAERADTGKGGGSPWRIALAWMAVIAGLGAAGAFVNTRLRR